MLTISMLVMTAAICLYRLWIIGACYQPDVGLFERSFISFTLPNCLTAAVVIALGALAFRAGKNEQRIERHMAGQGEMLLLAAAGCFLLSGVGYGALRFVVQAQVQVWDLLVCAGLLVMAFLLATLAPALKKGSVNQAAGGMAMVECAALLGLLVISYVGRTEMALLEQYMYYLLTLCAAMLAVLAICKAMVQGTSLKSALWFGMLTAYCAGGELLPAGLLEARQGAGLLPMGVFGLILAGILLTVAGLALAQKGERPLPEQPQEKQEEE